MSRLGHKKGRKSNYTKSLNNENHEEVRRRALLRDQYKCKICESKLYLELHHITYYLNSVSILGTELENDNMKWVVILCGCCHKGVHDNLNHRFNPKNKNKLPYNR